MRALIFAILSLAAFFANPVAAATDTPFAVGQVWTLKGDAYETTRVEIGKTEIWDDGKPIVHITVFNAPVTDDANTVVAHTTVGHMPYAEDALRRSVGTLVESNASPYPDFAGGYDMWKQAKGGVFTVTVQQAITAVITAARQAGHTPAPASSN